MLVSIGYRKWFCAWVVLGLVDLTLATAWLVLTEQTVADAREQSLAGVRRALLESARVKFFAN